MAEDGLLGSLPSELRPRPAPSEQELRIEALEPTRGGLLPFLQRALVARRDLRATEIEDVFRRQAETGSGYTAVLWEDRPALRDTLRDLGAFHFKAVSVDLDVFVPAPRLLELVDATTCANYQLIPVACFDRKLVVAMENPFNVFVLDDLRFRTGLDPVPVFAYYASIRRALGRASGGENGPAPGGRQPSTAPEVEVSSAASDVDEQGGFAGIDARIKEWQAIRRLGLTERSDSEFAVLLAELEARVKDPRRGTDTEQALVTLLLQAELPFVVLKHAQGSLAGSGRVGEQEDRTALVRRLLRRPWGAREWDRHCPSTDPVEAKIGDFLCRRGLLSEEGLRACLEAPSLDPFEGLLGRLTRLELAQEGDILQALAQEAGLSVTRSPRQPRHSLLSVVPSPIAHERGLLPLDRTADGVVLGVSNPFAHVNTAQWIASRIASDARLTLVLASELRAMVSLAYGPYPEQYEAARNVPLERLSLPLVDLSAFSRFLAGHEFEFHSVEHATRSDDSEYERIALLFDHDQIGWMSARYIDNHFWGSEPSVLAPTRWRLAVDDAVEVVIELGRLPASARAALLAYQEKPLQDAEMQEALAQYHAASARRPAEVERRGRRAGQSQVTGVSTPPEASQSSRSTSSQAEWFYLDAGVTCGPVSKQRLGELLQARLTAATPVWREGLSGWTRVDQLPELAVQRPQRLPFLGRDIPWRVVAGQYCRCLRLTPLARVEGEKVRAFSAGLPYGLLTVESRMLSGPATWPVTHRLDFQHLSEAFELHSQALATTEVLVGCSAKPKGALRRLFGTFLPRMHIAVHAKGAYEKLVEPGWWPRSQEDWAFARPLREWPLE